jgi:hypothetical protein
LAKRYGSGTWTRTKIPCSRGRCATDCTIPDPSLLRAARRQLAVFAGRAAVRARAFAFCDCRFRPVYRQARVSDLAIRPAEGLGPAALKSVRIYVLHHPLCCPLRGLPACSQCYPGLRPGLGCAIPTGFSATYVTAQFHRAKSRGARETHPSWTLYAHGEHCFDAAAK